MPKSLSQQCWEWISEQPDFHSTDLARAVCQPMPKIKSVMDEFLRKGYVEAANTAAKPYVYRKSEEATPKFSRGRPNSHNPRNSRQRIWQAIRFLGKRFTIEEVQAAANTSRSNVTRYLSDLVNYQYVIKVRGQWGPAPQKHARECMYLLVENTGRLYPVVRKTGLWDQNLKRLINKPQTTEE